LLPEWLDGGVGVCLFGLELHVCICDLGNGREVEDAGEEKTETGDSQVDPLHVAQGLLVIPGLEENHVGS